LHPYATDSRERLMVPFWLAILSVLLAYGLYLGLTKVKLLPPWWLDIPSVFGMYGILLGVFDRWAWRNQFFRWLRLVNVPDLQGGWRGTIGSSFTGQDGSTTARDVTVHITQTWSQICVSLDTDLSSSRSQIAGILVSCGPPNPLLTYDYLNEPKPSAPDTMHAHRGTVRLDVVDGWKTLDGQYYTGRDRITYGRLRLTRE
jgi:hypothetical protein